MALLTFSQFANVLFPYCRNGEYEHEFIGTLTNKIMEGKPGAKTYDGICRNPILSKSTRMKQYYFTGKRSISQKDASVILNRCNKSKFEDYLQHICSEEIERGLAEDLNKCLPQGTTVKDWREVIPFCADLFVDILKDLASGKADKRKKEQK